MKRYLYILISAILGATFIFSALTKLFPIQLFETALVEGYFSTWTLAPYISRAIIAFEFCLGLLLIVNFYFSKRVLQISILTLVIFTIHLVILLFTQGNQGNCMCFGNTIELTPGESIIKNLGMIAISFLLLKKHSGFNSEYKYAVLVVSAIIAILVPVVLNPPNNYVQNNPNDEAIGKSLNLGVLYEKDNKPEIDITKGKQVVAFLTLTCPHCRIAAYKFHVLKTKNPELPIFMILNGDSALLEDFFIETKSSNIPHAMLFGKDFGYRSGFKLPSIYYIENDTIVAHPKYVNIHQHELEEWIK